MAEFGVHRKIYHNEWHDRFGTFDQGTAAAALTSEQFRDVTIVRPSGTSNFPMFFMRHDQDDVVFQRYQIDHDWNPATSIKLHVHCIPMVAPTAPSRDVYWAVKYVFVPINVEVPINAGWSALVYSTLTLYPADAFLHKIHTLATIAPPGSVTPSSYLLVAISRFGTDGNDTYTDSKVGGTAAANLAILDFDVHYQVKAPGTITEGAF